MLPGWSTRNNSTANRFVFLKSQQKPAHDRLTAGFLGAPASAVTEGAAREPPFGVNEPAVCESGAEAGMPQESIDKVGGMFDTCLASIEACRRAGVKIGMGTDL